jgi:uncharacterized protein with HEPN domain
MRSSHAHSALRDIKDNIELARTFAAGLSLATFKADRKTVYAVIRCLEIVSEASRRLPADLKERHPNIPWSDVAGAGSIYRHGYQLVRDDVLWVTVRESPPLLAAVEQELARLK